MVKSYDYLSCLLIIILSSACSSTALKKPFSHPIDWTIYDGVEFSLYYPKEWQVDSSKNLETELILHSFMSNTDNFRENITIEKYKQEDSISNEKFLQKIETRLEENKLVWSQELVKNIKAKNNIYRFFINVNKEKLNIILYVFFYKSNVYIVNFTQQAHARQLESLAIQIMETFSLK